MAKATRTCLVLSVGTFSELVLFIDKVKNDTILHLYFIQTQALFGISNLRVLWICSENGYEEFQTASNFIRNILFIL